MNCVRNAFALIALLSCPLSAQQSTIPEAVAQMGPDPFFTTRIRELIAVPVDQLARQADLVVRGTFVIQDTQLSPDQRSLYTDYRLTSGQVIVARGVRASDRPGPQAMLSGSGEEELLSTVFR